MFKNVDPSDVSVKQFVTNKRFTVSDIDSGSGVFGLTGTSSSMYAFAVDTADATTFTNTTAPFSHSFFHIPVYRQINHLYYRDFPKPYNSYCFASESIRKLHSSLTAITVPREFYGEKINPGSIELTDDSADSTFSLRLAECAMNLYPSLLSLVESSNMLRSSVSESETEGPPSTRDSNTQSLTASMEHFTKITNDEHYTKGIKER